MSLVRIVAAVALAVAAPRPADACTVSGAPAAHAFGIPDGGPVGTQPWFSLWMVKGTVKLTRVPDTCKAETICKGTPISFDRTGRYVRPRAALPAGSRIQLTMGTLLLADVVVSKDPPENLPAFDGFDLVSAKVEPEGLCSPKGPVVRLASKTKPETLKGATLAVYLKKPDPKKPLKNLAYMTSLSAEIAIDNPLGGPAWLKQVPKKLWVVLVDGNGHVSTPIEITP